MNDARQLDEELLHREACLNTLMYLSDYYEVEDGKSVAFILEQVGEKIKTAEKMYLADGHTERETIKKYGDDKRKLAVLNAAINNDKELGSLVIANQSSKMKDPVTGEPYETGGINACTFQDDLSNPSVVIVVFRGTGEGEWYDNGLGLSGEVVGTGQQIQAAKYFDYLVELNGWNETNPDIYATGHSKGGNKAQYVVMTSEYSDLIINGYSMDGQGMSQETIDYLKEKYGIEEFIKRQEKLYSISADNDYVNVLGVNNQDGRIIPAEHIFYLESVLSGMAWHYPDCYINDDGTITGFTEQGDVSKYIQGLSEAAMDLPAPIRSIITNGAMAIAQMALGKTKPVNGEKFYWEDILAAIPLIISMIPPGIVEKLGNEHGVNMDWLANVLTASELIIYAPVTVSAKDIGEDIDNIIEIISEIKMCGATCEEYTARVILWIEESIDNIEEWWSENFTTGGQYSELNPQIRVDTYKLRNYAYRLENVNRRIKVLDERMDSLYREAGLMDIWNLMQADVFTAYSQRLSRCSEYLINTADDFENAERSILKYL